MRLKKIGPVPEDQPSILVNMGENTRTNDHGRKRTQQVPLGNNEITDGPLGAWCNVHELNMPEGEEPK